MIQVITPIVLTSLQKLSAVVLGFFIAMRAFQIPEKLAFRAFSETLRIYCMVVFAIAAVMSHYAGTIVLFGEEIILPLSIVFISGAFLYGDRAIGLFVAIVAMLHMLVQGGVLPQASLLSLIFTAIIGFAITLPRSLRDLNPLYPMVATVAVSTIIFLCSAIVLLNPILLQGSSISAWGYAWGCTVPLVAGSGLALLMMYFMFQNRGQIKEQAAALKAGKIFSISEQALGYIKEGMNSKTAKKLARLLADELRAAAVTIIDTESVLAHVNRTEREWNPEVLLQDPYITEMLKGTSAEVVHCELTVPAILIPFRCSEQSAGIIVVYFEHKDQIGQWETAFTEGLGKLISYQLSIIETERLRLLLKDTEMRALQAQINPHFLFNTLNIIVSLIRTNPDQAKEVMMHLSNFMRMNLRLTSSALVSLEQELCLLESFIQIIRIRFADQLHIELMIDEELEYFKIPPVTIQPLVENCIQHGLRKKPGIGEILIKIVKVDSGAQVIVEDNGKGISEERLSLLKKQHIYSRKGNGIGFYNVNQRLTSLLGEQSHLSIENRESGGCRVSFFLPNMYADWGNNR